MSNLPPGVNVNMIPGNRPEDLADEAFWETLSDKLTDAQNDLLDDANSDLVAVVEAIRDLAWAAGAAEERAHAEIEAAMTPNPTFTDEELEALATTLGAGGFRENEVERRAVQKVLSAAAARDPDRPF